MNMSVDLALPKILRVSPAGQPVGWLHWQSAARLYTRQLVLWTLGEPVLHLRGGYCRVHQRRSSMSLHSIIACGGRKVPPRRLIPPLVNQALFRRDENLCMYCGNPFPDSALTRDHVVPRCRGGAHSWENLVTACYRCNHHKGDRPLAETGLELKALPYMPNYAEYLALINSGRILGDQMEFLRPQFGRDSRHGRLM